MYNGQQNVFVTVKTRYMNNMLGLCGNYNENKNDDLIMPDKRQANDVLEFGNSWKVWHTCPNENPREHPWVNVSSIVLETKKKCHLLKEKPFSTCHTSTVNHNKYIEDCEFDVCACNDGSISCLCQAFEDYATSCSFAGVPITWKDLPQFSLCKGRV